MTDIVVSPPTSALPTRVEWDSLREVADTLGRSGIFKDVRSVEQAIAKVMFGRDLGLGATQAMTGIHMVEGKPELSANLQAALLRQYRSPEGARYDYKADVSPSGCAIEVYRIHADGIREDVGRTTFTMEDAKVAGLAGRGPWKSYPANMCFARAMSNAVAFFAPEVGYGTRVYTDGEIDSPGREDVEPPALVDEPILDAEVVVEQLADKLGAVDAPEIAV